MLYPITFSIPEEKVICEVPPKTKLLSDLIPGDSRTYIYKNETDYYNEYKASIFATTTKKAGWDCMRHYEIMANGCIPYFPNIEECPKNTMALLPKDLLYRGNELYDKYKNKNIDELTSEEAYSCYKLIKELITYTRNNLTTRKMAEYILEKTNYKGVSNILYLSQNTSPDYLRCVTLHGFKCVFGEKCHDYPMIPHIYKMDTINYSSLYGRGITYSNLLNTDLHDSKLDATIVDDIKNRKYDLVIYGSYHRGMPYYDIVSNVYDPKRIILLCGEDIHGCSYKEWIDRGHHVFVREL